MPNTHAAFGQSIANILSRATGARSAAPQGYSQGLDAESQHMLRSAQTGKTMADTDKIMYELGLAKDANAVSAPQLAQAMGVDQGAYDALSVPGATTMPAIPGPQGPSPAVPIPQAMRDKFTNANTLKVLQQLTGGTTSGANADTLMSALLKGQKLGTMSNMQSGAQNTGDVATMRAAIEGKYPGRTGAGGGSTTAKVQETADLTRRYRAQGMSAKDAQTKAITTVYGDGKAKQIDQLMQAMVRSRLYEPEEITAMLPTLLESRGQLLDPTAVKAPGNVVKRYQ